MKHEIPTPVLTAGAMRQADEHTIRAFGIPGFTLMESAGRGAAAAIGRRLPAGGRVAIYCGKGNNGGDGFVIARSLHAAGATVRVLHLGEPGSMSTDADSHFDLLRSLARHDPDGRLFVEPYDPGTPLPPADAHVDALLGTGLTSDLREPIRSLVARLNEARGIKIAVDIPTGLHSDRGRVLGTAFRANHTLTMGALKTGLLLNDGPLHAGEVETLEIGIPPHVLRQAPSEGTDGCAFLSGDALVRGWLPARGSDANKYAVGLALVVAGSAGMTGAPVMASTAAARAGAGYVVCASDHRIIGTLGAKLTEITTVSLPAGDAGLDPEGSISALSDRMTKARALLIGCGLGRGDRTAAFVRRLLETTDRPVVLDADGLNAVIGHTELLSRRSRGRWILTPHMGEFKRLVGAEEVDADDRIALAQRYAARWNCVLILKGLPSVTATPDGRAWVNTTGGPALASAGTGDILAGLCTGLLAQGLSPEEAAVAGLHLGGAAADRYAASRAGRSLLATDMLEELPLVIKERFEP